MHEESPLVVMAGIGGQLIPDAAIAESHVIGSADGLVRRSYVRAVFALVEGLNYARLYIAKESAHLLPDARAKADVAAQSEKRKAKEDDAGGVPSSTRVSFAAFAAAHGVENPLVATGSEWDAFLAAIAVRNRITHPLSSADCAVSDEDVALVRKAHHWYQDLDMRLLRNVEQSRDGA